MDSIQLSILARLCSMPGGGGGCGSLFVLVVFTFIITLLFDLFKIVLISLFAIIVVTITILIFVKLFPREQSRSALYERQETKEKQEREFQLIKTLAEDFINKTITLNKSELNRDDYKKFYGLVKEHNIEVENNYATEVPYKIREILYNAYLKKMRELKNNL